MTQRVRMRGRTLAIGAAVAATLVLAACSGASDNEPQAPVPSGANQDALDPRGPDATKILDLFSPFFWIAVVIGVVVLGATIYVAVRFRARADDERPRQVHGHTGLEIGWTIVPAVILAVMAVPTVATIFDLAERPPDSLEIHVTGKQWWWEYEYVDAGVFTANELHIPAGEPVSLHLTSTDVIHSFWVPNLAGKKDAVPGRDHFLRMEADEPGTYLGQCAEYCGLSHANMRLRVIAHEPAEFEAWLADQQREITAEQQDFVDNGVVSTYGCTSCHSFDPTVDTGIAPNLSHLASRSAFAGAIFDLTPENLRRWVRTAPDMKPMQTSDPPGAAPSVPGQVPGMPAFPAMTDDEADQLVDFLLSLD